MSSEEPGERVFFTDYSRSTESKFVLPTILKSCFAPITPIDLPQDEVYFDLKQFSAFGVLYTSFLPSNNYGLEINNILIISKFKFHLSHP